MSTLYLHIGTPKTGTSAIQFFLANNEKNLNLKRYTYPDLGVHISGKSLRRNAIWLQKGAVEKKQRAEIFNNLENIAKKYPNILLSDEGIWNSRKKSKKFWKRLKRKLEKIGIELKVVVYLRRQDEFVFSHWAQKVKEANGRSFEDYVESGAYKKRDELDYIKYLNRIAKRIGKENVIVRVYERQQFEGGDLISDFLKAVGLEMGEEWKLNKSTVNISLSGICLEVKRRLNCMSEEFKKPESEYSKRNFSVYYLEKLQERYREEGKYQGRSIFPSFARKKMLEEFEEGNGLVAKKFLKRKNRKLFYDKPQEKDEVVGYSNEEVEAVMGDMMLMIYNEKIVEGTIKKIKRAGILKR